MSKVKLKLIKKSLIIFLIIFPSYLLGALGLIIYYLIPQLPMTTFGYPMYIENASFRHYRVHNPKIHFGNNNEIYISFEEYGKTYEGIKVYASNDDGNTWKDISPPSVANDNNDITTSYSKYDITVSKKGEISIIYSLSMTKWKSKDVGSQIKNDNIYFIKKLNNNSWTSPKILTNNHYAFFTHTFINDTAIIMSYDLRLPDRTFFMISNDLGDTWKNQSSFLDLSTRKLIHQENQILFLKYLDCDDRGIKLMKSDDLGLSWVKINTSILVNSDTLTFNPKDKKLYDIFIEKNRIKMIYSEDNGTTWEYWDPEDLKNHPPVYGAYIGGISLDFSSDGKCMIAYDCYYAYLFWTYNGINYFIIGEDIWFEKNISFFTRLFLMTMMIGLIIFLILSITISLVFNHLKGINPKKKDKIKQLLHPEVYTKEELLDLPIPKKIYIFQGCALILILYLYQIMILLKYGMI